MNRDFKTPQDVANAGPERVAQSLVKVVRRGVTERPFLMRLHFRYSGGRTAPVLYIGEFNRSWDDYISNNLRANDLVVGVCETQRGEAGRTLVRLDVRRGRGERDAYLTQLNRSMRDLNVEAAFGPAGAAAEAAPQASPAAEARAPVDLAAEFKALRERFEAFKKAPSTAALEDLGERVERWQAASKSVPGSEQSKAAQQVAKLKAVLEAQGAKYAAKSTG